MKYDSIIFDCDGTLLDSELVYNECAIEMFAQLGLPRYRLDYTLENWMGRALNDIIAFEEKKNNVEIDAGAFIANFIAATPAYMKKYLREVAGALDSVRQLVSKFSCCVASNGELPNIIASLNIAGYDDVFEANRIYSKNMVERAKPAPDLFLYACAQMGSTPGRTIVVEDSLSGIRAGRAANMYTIAYTGVSHDPDIRNKAKDAGADIVFNDWRDIVIHINSL